MSVRGLLVVTALCVAVCFGPPSATGGAARQDGDKGTITGGYGDHDIDAASVTKKRPAEKRPADRRNKTAPKKKHVYKPGRDFPVAPPPAGKEHVDLGVTLCRLDPAATPGGGKALTDEEEPACRLAEDDAPLEPGDRVRLFVESLTREAYLYIVNYEQYDDGTRAEESLIFPTLSTRHGDNKVGPGLPVAIPGTDRAFRVNPRNRGRKTQVAEGLFIILSPDPLSLPGPLGPRAMPLPAALVNKWEKDWGLKVSRVALSEGVGQIMGRSKSLEDEAEPLTSDDAPPQAFYRAVANRNAPALFPISLRFRVANGAARAGR